METSLNSAAIAKAHKAIDAGKIDHGEWTAPPDSERDPSDCAGSDKSYPIFKGEKVSAKGVASALGYARKNAPKLVSALEGLDNAIKKKSGTKMSRGNGPLVFNFSSEFRPAVTLGQALPKDIDGIPAHYYWKEMLPLGRAIDKDGGEIEVTTEYMDKIVSCFNRAKDNGYRPFLTPHHDLRDANSSLGRLIDVRRNDRGVLEGLHQFVGDDAKKAAARNGSSICLVNDVTDEKGNRYEVLIDHNAIIPDPKFFGLGDFKPALAASRGDGEPPVVYQFSGGTDMGLSTEQVAAVKGLVGGDGLSADNAFDKLVEFTKQEKQAREDLKQRLSASEEKVLQFSRGTPAPPDPEILRDRRELSIDRINSAVSDGDIPAEIAGKLKEKTGTSEKPNTFMFSRSADLGDRPLDWALGLFKGTKLGRKVDPPTGSQTVHQFSRQTPGGDGDESEKKAREAGAALGKKAVDEELARRGLATAGK